MEIGISPASNQDPFRKSKTQEKEEAYFLPVTALFRTRIKPVAGLEATFFLPAAGIPSFDK